MAKVSKQKNLRQVDKAQACEDFATIVESLTAESGVVEVTDRGKVMAVIISHKYYLRLLAQAREPFDAHRKLANSAELVGDLESISNDSLDCILGSVEKSAREL